MKFSKFLKFVLILLPLVVIGSAALIYTNNELNTPSLRWFSDDAPISGTCEAIESLKVYQAERVTLRDLVTLTEVSSTATGVITPVLGSASNEPLNASTPLLVAVTLPDHGRVTAWLIVVEMERGEFLHKAASFYLSDVNFEVLEVIYATSAVDPLAGCR